MLDIRPAVFPRDLEALLDLWREYVASPSVSLDFQDNETEFARLPGKYASAAGGRVLLAESGADIVGGVAFRRVDDTVCEMKRLYVRPAARGLGAGRQLVERLLAEARQAGYREMRLDVLPEFEQAARLYLALGFEDAEPVSLNPVPGTRFLGRRL